MVAHFAMVDVASVTSASGVRLDGVRAYTDLVFGTYHKGDYDHRIVVLLRCTARQCVGQTVFLRPGVAALRGLVDLNGKGGVLDSGRDVEARGDWSTSLSGKGLAWPALVLEIEDERPAKGESRFGTKYDGSERHHVLQIVSLRRADAEDPQLAVLPTMDLYPSGAGGTVAYRLERGTRKQVLDIVGPEPPPTGHDSACLEPEPVDVRWVLAKGRFQRVDDLARRGCH